MWQRTHWCNYTAIDTTTSQTPRCLLLVCLLRWNGVIIALKPVIGKLDILRHVIGCCQPIAAHLWSTLRRVRVTLILEVQFACPVRLYFIFASGYSSTLWTNVWHGEIISVYLKSMDHSFLVNITVNVDDVITKLQTETGFLHRGFSQAC